MVGRSRGVSLRSFSRVVGFEGGEERTKLTFSTRLVFFLSRHRSSSGSKPFDSSSRRVSSKPWSLSFSSRRRILNLPFSSSSYRATSALDSGAEHQVNQAISTILQSRSITIILVAHRLSSIARAERVFVLEKGRVTEEGLYSDLVRPFLPSFPLLIPFPSFPR